MSLIGTRSADHIRASSQGGCIQRPNTWLHPNASLHCQIHLATRAPSSSFIHEQGPELVSISKGRKGVNASNTGGQWSLFDSSDSKLALLTNYIAGSFGTGTDWHSATPLPENAASHEPAVVVDEASHGLIDQRPFLTSRHPFRWSWTGA